MKRTIIILLVFISCKCWGQSNMEKCEYYDSLYSDAEDSLNHYKPTDLFKLTEILVRQTRYSDSIKKYLALWAIDNNRALDSMINILELQEDLQKLKPIGTPIKYSLVDTFPTGQTTTTTGRPFTPEYLKTHKIYTAVRRGDTIYLPDILYTDTTYQKDNLKYYEKQFRFYRNKYTSVKGFNNIKRYVDSAMKYRQLIDKIKFK